MGRVGDARHARISKTMQAARRVLARRRRWRIHVVAFVFHDVKGTVGGTLTDRDLQVQGAHPPPARAHCGRMASVAMGRGLPPLLLVLLVLVLGVIPAGGDGLPPYFHPGYPHAASITGTSFVLNLKLTEAGVAHYAVVKAAAFPNGDAGADAPEIPAPAEVRAGLLGGYAGRNAVNVGVINVVRPAVIARHVTGSHLTSETRVHRWMM